MNKPNLFLTLIAASVIAAGCGKTESKDTNNQNSQAANSDKTSSSEGKNVEKPNLSTPSSAYREMKNEADLVYAYYSIFPGEVNYGNIATTISEKYSKESDGFKQQDIIAGLKPEMDAALNKAKESKYYFLQVKPGKIDVRPYNFESKTFYNPTLGEIDPYRSYAKPYFELPYAVQSHPYIGTKLEFSNTPEFINAKVEDQDAAKKIEGLRASRKLDMKIYYFVNDQSPNELKLIAQITKIDFTNINGEVIFSQVK